MTFPLRITLFAASLLTFAYMTMKIRDSKMRLEDSLFWFCFSALLLLVSIFPQVFFLAFESCWNHVAFELRVPLLHLYPPDCLL